MTPTAPNWRYAFTVSKGVSLSESLAPTNPIGFLLATKRSCSSAEGPAPFEVGPPITPTWMQENMVGLGPRRPLSSMSLRLTLSSLL
jgi:hypothetical protein